MIHSLDLASAAPSGEVLAFHKGKLVYQSHWGKKYRYYDLASLTKILFTNELYVLAHANKLIRLDAKVQSYLPYWHKNIMVKDLLRHSAGYTWWKPFYKMIPQNLDFNLRYMYLQNLVLKEKPKLPAKTLYSDIDYFILGFILEKVFSSPLHELLVEINSPFHFNLENKSLYTKGSYAPTEKCPWRKKRMQAEVHDQNTWALGGLAPHAGLFGGAKEMKIWFEQFYSAYRAKKYKPFTKRQKGDWALGYMMPTKGSASCGEYFSLDSFGHTGFTGTSFWFDPKKDFAVIILSNRLFYGASNQSLKKLRPVIHNTLYKGLFK